MRNNQRILVKTAIQLVLVGYQYNTNVGEDPDEHEKLLDIPNILREIADEYKRINKEVTEEMTGEIV